MGTLHDCQQWSAILLINYRFIFQSACNKSLDLFFHTIVGLLWVIFVMIFFLTLGWMRCPFEPVVLEYFVAFYVVTYHWSFFFFFNTTTKIITQQIMFLIFLFRVCGGSLCASQSHYVPLLELFLLLQTALFIKYAHIHSGIIIVLSHVHGMISLTMYKLSIQ